MSTITTWDDGTTTGLGEPSVALMPKAYPGDGSKRGAVFSHRHDGLETDMMIFGPGKYTDTFYAFGDAGFPMITPLEGGNTWGNDIALSSIDAAVGYLGTGMGAATDKVIVAGYSMGGGAAYAWARANKDRVACMVLFMPVSDLQDMVSNNRGGLRGSINAAYGGSYNNLVYGPTHNPAVFASQLAGIPVQIWYAVDDTIVVPATVLAVAGQIGTVDLHTTTGGHLDFTDVALSRVASFLQANQ